MRLLKPMPKPIARCRFRVDPAMKVAMCYRG